MIISSALTCIDCIGPAKPPIDKGLGSTAQSYNYDSQFMTVDSKTIPASWVVHCIENLVLLVQPINQICLICMDLLKENLTGNPWVS